MPLVSITGNYVSRRNSGIWHGKTKFETYFPYFYVGKSEWENGPTPPKTHFSTAHITLEL